MIIFRDVFGIRTVVSLFIVSEQESSIIKILGRGYSYYGDFLVVVVVVVHDTGATGKSFVSVLKMVSRVCIFFS